MCDTRRDRKDGYLHDFRLVLGFKFKGNVANAAQCPSWDLRGVLLYFVSSYPVFQNLVDAPDNAHLRIVTF